MQTNTIALPVGELRPALTGLGKLISKSSTLPVLSCVRISRDPDGWVHLSGTNMDAFATARIEAPSPGPESTILVPLSDLTDVAKRCGSNDTVTVADTGESIEIACPLGGQSLVHRAERIDPAEFPVAPVTDMQAHAIEDAVRVALLEAISCASTDQTRYVIQGAYLDVAQSTGHYIIGTDGRHLYSANTFKLPIDDSLIIPAHRFLQWKPFAADGEWRIRVFQTGPDKNPWISLCSRRWEFTIRQVEGNYPNYRQVIPADEAFTTSIRFDDQGVKFAIDALGKLPGADQNDKPVAIRIENGKASFGSRPPADASWIELPGATVTGADVHTTLNRSFVLKALTIGLTQIDIASPCDPLRFRQGGRQIVAMPLRTGDSTSVPAPASPPQPETAETAPQPPAQPNEKHMNPTTAPQTNGSNHHTPATNGNGNGASPVPTNNLDALSEALQLADALRIRLRDTASDIAALTTALKRTAKERKDGEKEVHQVRQTLRSLQGVKL